MSYNNFDENRPNQNNGILTDIDSINEALNILREQGLSTNFPTNTTAGMPFARLETRDDNSLQDKVVVYRRNADDDDWLKVYDEEYGQNADLYKGNDIDSDGDGKVNSAENADNADNADYAELAAEALSLQNFSPDDFSKFETGAYTSNDSGEARTFNLSFQPKLVLLFGTSASNDAGPWWQKPYFAVAAYQKIDTVNYLKSCYVSINGETPFTNYHFGSTFENLMSDHISIIEDGFSINHTDPEDDIFNGENMPGVNFYLAFG